MQRQHERQSRGVDDSPVMGGQVHRCPTRVSWLTKARHSDRRHCSPARQHAPNVRRYEQSSSFTNASNPHSLAPLSSPHFPLAFHFQLLLSLFLVFSSNKIMLLPLAPCAPFPVSVLSLLFDNFCSLANELALPLPFLTLSLPFLRAKHNLSAVTADERMRLLTPALFFFMRKRERERASARLITERLFTLAFYIASPHCIFPSSLLSSPVLFFQCPSFLHSCSRSTTGKTWSS